MVRVGRISFSGQSDLRTGNQQKNTPGRIRTCDTRFRKAVLYPLSYEGIGYRTDVVVLRG